MILLGIPLKLGAEYARVHTAFGINIYGLLTGRP